MKVLAVLVLTCVTLPLSWGAPVLDVEDPPLLDHPDGVHNHTDPDRDGRYFTNNLIDVGDISISGHVQGGDVSIGSKLDIHSHSFVKPSDVEITTEQPRTTTEHPRTTTQRISTTIKALAVDGGWSPWGEYSECSNQCGGGKQTKMRTCTNPVPQHGGRSCEKQKIGDSTETKDCNLHDCEKFPCEFDDELLSPQLSGDGQLSPHDTSKLFKWKNNKVPYYFTNENTKQEDKYLVRSVMNRFKEATCFRFEEKNKEDYENEHSLEIYIENVSCRRGVSGYVQKVPYKNKLELVLTAHLTTKRGRDCGTKGLIIHELMHVLGVGHTQRRRDRDNFITVNLKNLDGARPGIKDQYKICQNCKLYDEVPYDCGSIMHYGTHLLGKQVIIPKHETCELKWGHLVHRVWDAPAKDWELLNVIGNCPESSYSQASSTDINYAARMKNIGQLFKGYNILYGNPLPLGSTTAVDPGFQQPIFEGSYKEGKMTSDRRFLQPDGTDIVQCGGGCSLDFKATGISGAKSYQENLAKKVGFSVGGSGVGWEGKFSASVEYGEVNEQTSKHSNFYTLSSASCCQYTAKILYYTPPPLSQNFRVALGKLPENYNEEDYVKFIDTFGTHVISEAHMGARYGQQTEITAKSWTSMLERGINILADAELAALGSTGSVSLSSNEDIKKVESFKENAKSQQVFSIGEKPPADGKVVTWVQKIISEPAPIQLILGDSIADLFDNHDDIKVSKAVKENMKKALKEYCGILLKRGQHIGLTCSALGPDRPFPSVTRVFGDHKETDPIIFKEHQVDTKYWGDWKIKETCPFPHVVNQMQLKIEGSQGDGDDSALNGIRMKCTDGSIISSSEQRWGSWGDYHACPWGSFIKKATMRRERPQGRGDDTSANGIRFECTDGSRRNPGDGLWGDWTNEESCSDGSAVYGIVTRIESAGNDDETALNDVKFYCAKVIEGIKLQPFHKPQPRQKITVKTNPFCLAGWFDVQGLGEKNDYCGWVGDCGCDPQRCSWWSCALAGSKDQLSPRGQFSPPGYTFLVVVGDRVTHSVGNLETAIQKLREITAGKRLIAEVDPSGKLKRDPHEVGGQNQGAGLAAGFNRHWDDYFDINWMMDVAQRYLDAEKGITHPHPRQQIHDKGHPHCLAGWFDVQGLGEKKDYCRWVGDCGCDPRCGSWWSCALAGSKVHYSPKGEFSPPGYTFLVVEGDHVYDDGDNMANSYDSLESAISNLMKITAGSRLIAEVDPSGKLKRDPHEVGGHYQGAGLVTGFNRHWDDWNDINRMMDVAQRFLDAKKVLPRQQNIGDLGLGYCLSGWFDVQKRGVKNDYCRWVGNGGCRGQGSWWSCALAGTNAIYSPKGKYSQPVLTRQNIGDSGIGDCLSGWFDVQGQGVKNDYCRWVGTGGCRGQGSWWSCALAGTKSEHSPRGKYSEPELVTDGTCYEDNAKRLLHYYNHDSQTNTPEECKTSCANHGYSFAGVQSGVQCFCGNSLPPESKIRAKSECNASCTGDASLKCGGHPGSWRMNVYNR